ncbi:MULTISPECIES: DUF72 domain-containing protein [Sporosarcina]|uniref:DUF72 domain-containing protein n=1 Tax=Sporosarcina TaxID=1569 RepID=UPI00058C5301|nr:MULTISPECIES: DUF72 domain-containing protein [Sporosarcina]WJY27770.1 DUF72 domain-containing protein [Sporosarcina sp. 0.2-SM1T-5]
MIEIGLTGWGDHPDVYAPTSSAKDKLIDYSAHFPIVELDSTFYAIQPERNIRKWIRETPDHFQFIVKAYQGMTGHLRGELPYESKEEMFRLFRLSLQPLEEADKLSMILIQFPPWFDCVKEHVEEIRYICGQLEGFDLAVEFRHQSWYSEQLREKTFKFLSDNKLIHVITDEPQAGEGSVPFIPRVTHPDKAMVRLHGRNLAGWKNPGGSREAWRKVRYLYDYNDRELQEIQAAVEQASEHAAYTAVIFNNNSGGHAAGNAKQFQQMLGLSFEDLAPKQLDIFEGE